jgi:hypothetical protein
MYIEEIQRKLFIEYEKNDYLRMWSNNFSKLKNQQNSIYDIAELGLINTEISEAIEEIRKKDIDEEIRLSHLGVECADIIIRVLNFMSRKGISANYYINYKHNINMNREKLHGKEV